MKTRLIWEASKIKLGKRVKIKEGTQDYKKMQINRKQWYKWPTKQVQGQILNEIEIHYFILLRDTVLSKYTMIIYIYMSLNKIAT